MTNLLFVCSKNQWRSPTAENVWCKQTGFNARSAGTAKSAKRQVKLDDIIWADHIFVMEDKHASRLRADFRQDLKFKKPIVLDIPDDYRFMNQDLQHLVLEKVSSILE